MRTAVEMFADEQTLCGEAPTWDAGANRLLWVDNERGLVFARGRDDAATTVLVQDHPAFGLALNDDGRLVMAGPRGVALHSADGRITTVLENPDGGEWCFNDAKASPAGGLYAGSFHWGASGMERPGRLCHVTPLRDVEVLDEGIQLSNGLALSPDSRALYFADTMARTIYAYDVRANGHVENRRVFARVHRDEGLPDGLAVDADGFVWCALWYGGQVIRFDPTGVVERQIRLPARQVSSVAFGGRDLDELFVTTAANHWPSDHQPPGFDPHALMGGAVYRVRLDVRGKPEHKCRFRT